MEWKRGIGNDSSKVFDERGRIVATCSPDDGTAIVRAVNTFDQAREALKDACLTYAVHGDQPPQKWLDALAAMNGEK